MCNNETVEFMFEMTITRTGSILLGLYSVIVNSEKRQFSVINQNLGYIVNITPFIYTTTYLSDTLLQPIHTADMLLT